jgi:hypothetical protein
MNDWFDYRLETDPRFLDRIAAARASLHASHGLPLEDVDDARGANQTYRAESCQEGSSE